MEITMAHSMTGRVFALIHFHRSRLGGLELETKHWLRATTLQHQTCAVPCCAVHDVMCCHSVTCCAVMCRLGVLYIVWLFAHAAMLPQNTGVSLSWRAVCISASEYRCLPFMEGSVYFCFFTYWWPSCVCKFRTVRMSLSKDACCMKALCCALPFRSTNSGRYESGGVLCPCSRLWLCQAKGECESRLEI